MAAAAKNSGGIVMVQVDEVVPRDSIHPQNVTVPANLVDYVIEGSPGNTGQHFLDDGKAIPSWSGDEKIDLDKVQPMALNAR